MCVLNHAFYVECKLRGRQGSNLEFKQTISSYSNKPCNLYSLCFVFNFFSLIINSPGTEIVLIDPFVLGSLNDIPLPFT